MTHLLVLGGAGSGKSTFLADELAQLPAAGRGPDVLGLLPTGGELRSFAELVMARAGREALVGVRLLTLGGLAREVLRSSGGRAAPEISRPERLETAAALLLALRGRLKALGRSAGLPGLARAAERSFAELRSGGVSAVDFNRAWRAAARRLPGAEGRLFRAKCADLALLYAEYGKRLEAAGLEDAEGRLLAAARALSAAEAGLPGGAHAVFLDGFAQFTAAQAELVSAALSRAEESAVALCFDGEPEGRLAHAGRAYETIARARSDWQIKRLESAPRFASRDLARLEAGLFSKRRGSGSVENITVTAAPSLRAECESAARRCARLVREEGFRPGELAVFARDLSPYAAELERAFRLAGLPLAVARPRALAESAVAGELLGWLRAAAGPESGTAAALAAAMRGPLASRGSREAAAEIAAQAAERGLASAAELEVGRLSEGAAAQLKDARDLLAALRAALPDAPAPPAEWASAGGECLQLLDLPNRLIASRRSGAEAARGLIAFAELSAALSGAAAAAERAGLARLSHETYVGLLELALTGRSLPAPRARAGGVLAANVFEARAGERRAAFVLGLAEGFFPRPARENPLLSDRERELLAGAGVELRLTAWTDDEERYLFYIAATRASERLSLSWPTGGGEGRPREASSFLDDCAAVFAPGELAKVTTRRPAGRALPPLEEAAWRGELLGALAAAFNSPRITSEPAARDWRLALALHRRALAREFFSAEELARLAPRVSPLGGLQEKAVLDIVAERSAAQSASGLDIFENCPFAHFLARVCSLAARRRLEFDEALSGQLLHAALRRLFEMWRQNGEPPRSSDVEAALRAEVRERFPWLLGQARLEPFLAAQVPLVARALESDAQAIQASGARPAYMELAFGGGDARCDPASREQPLILGEGLALRGRIDRVDLLDDGRNAVVVDYKRSVAGGGGLDRQLGLYALALREVFDLQPAAVGFRVLCGERTVYGHVTEELRDRLAAYGFGKRLEDEGLEEVLSAARELARRAAGSDARVWPLDCRNCPDREAYNPICRFQAAEWRRAYGHGEEEGSSGGG